MEAREHVEVLREILIAMADDHPHKETIEYAIKAVKEARHEH